MHKINWRTRKESNRLQENGVPDVILDYMEWSRFAAQYLRQHAPKRRTSTSIYQWMSKAGSIHHMQGNGSYTTDEVLALAGIPPWVPAFDVLNDEYLYAVLHESHFQFLLERVYRMDEHLKTTRRTSKAGEYAMTVTYKEQKEFGEQLWVHAKKMAKVNPYLGQLIEAYNTLSEASKQWAKGTHFEEKELDDNLEDDLEDELETNLDLLRQPTLTHAFDLALIRHSCLLWGHLGPVIVGNTQQWDEVVNRQAGTALELGSRKFNLHTFVDRLPRQATRMQRLALTPITQLTDADKQLLEDVHGSVHPITEYFREKRANEAKKNLKKNTTGQGRTSTSYASHSISPPSPFFPYKAVHCGLSISWNYMDFIRRTIDEGGSEEMTLSMPQFEAASSRLGSFGRRNTNFSNFREYQGEFERMGSRMA
ncbi:hypothetical protein B0H15DRAFT_801818 [Mycena belliarum]|uniref:Uncharacterized protein n=1 Tax=Mycena belliarum TaxID=1033014 RepID=A0AAD6XMV5_9AGAR|nr:hypothetical protein B0H15DRAFT_801818 [Mycena belliae]